MSFVWRKRWFLLLFPLLLAASIWQIRVETDLNAFFTATDNEDSRLLSGLLKSGELSRRYLLVVEKINGSNLAMRQDMPPVRCRPGFPGCVQRQAGRKLARNRGRGKGVAGQRAAPRMDGRHPHLCPLPCPAV